MVSNDSGALRRPQAQLPLPHRSSGLPGNRPELAGTGPRKDRPSPLSSDRLQGAEKFSLREVVGSSDGKGAVALKPCVCSELSVSAQTVGLFGGKASQRESPGAPVYILRPPGQARCSLHCPHRPQGGTQAPCRAEASWDQACGEGGRRVPPPSACPWACVLPACVSPLLTDSWL